MHILNNSFVNQSVLLTINELRAFLLLSFAKLVPLYLKRITIGSKYILES